MNNENNIKRDEKLDLVSMIIGIVSLCFPCPPMICPSIAGLILGFKCKEKTKKRKAGIILNIIALIIEVGVLVVIVLGMGMANMTYDEYEANKTFTNLSMYIPEDWIEAEEEDWGFNSAKTYVYRNFEYIDNWETTDLETDIIKGGEKNKKSLCEITIKDYNETYKMYESFTNQNYSDLEKYKLNKESFDISKNDILLEEKLAKKEFNDIEFEYAVDKSTHSKTHYYFLDAGNNGLYEIVIWDMKNCDKYIEHIEESFELYESSSNNVQNYNEINNESTEDNQQIQEDPMSIDEFISLNAQYNVPVKIVKSDSDLNATSEYRNQYYRLDSMENVKKYVNELTGMALVNWRDSIITLDNEEYLNMFWFHFGLFIDEGTICFEKGYVRDKIIELYDQDIGEGYVSPNFSNVDNYYCSGPRFGGAGGNFEYKSEKIYDTIDSHVFEYIYQNDVEERHISIEFKKIGNIYKLIDFNVYDLELNYN